MVLVSFSEIEKAIDVREGRCTMTIRPPRKRAWKRGDLLHLWYKSRTKQRRFLGLGVLKSVKRVPFGQITEEEFVLDGFQNKAEAHQWFLENTHQYIEQYAKTMIYLPYPYGLRDSDVLERAPFDILQWELVKRIPSDAPPPEGRSPFSI